jgi:hypothetical protein
LAQLFVAQQKPKLFAPYLLKTTTSAKTIQTLQLTTTTVETRKKIRKSVDSCAENNDDVKRKRKQRWNLWKRRQPLNLIVW